MAKGKRTRSSRSGFKRRLKRRFKRKLQRKRFIRQLNSVAEKKIKTVLAGQPCLPYNQANLDPGIGIISDNLPVFGTGNNNRIGSKIFVRYCTLEAFYANSIYPPVTQLSGLMSHIIVKERWPYVTERLTAADICNSMNGHPCLNPYLLKYTYTKMKKYDFRYKPHERTVIDGTDGVNQLHGIPAHGEHTNARIFKKRFKIMKNVNLMPVGAAYKIDIPDIVWFPVYWHVDYTIAVGNPSFQFRLTMTFTDV